MREKRVQTKKPYNTKIAALDKIHFHAIIRVRNSNFTTLRSELSLRVGDLLEAKIEGDQIIMKPRMVVDKSQAWKRLFEVLNRVNSKNKEFSPEEVEQDVLAAIRESRGK